MLEKGVEELWLLLCEVPPRRSSSGTALLGDGTS